MNYFLSLCFTFSLLFSGFSSSESEHVTRIGAALDGNVSLRDGSGRVVGTFSTGPRIRSSSQDQDFVSVRIGKFFTDVVEDDFILLHGSGPAVGDLFLYSRLDVVKMMLSESIGIRFNPYMSEIGGFTPYMSEKEAVTLGSRKTTGFVVDSKTGRLIRTYSSPDSQYSSPLAKSGSANNAEPQHKELHNLLIIRTDYHLYSFPPNSFKVSWSMKVVEIAYAFACQDLETQFITGTMNLSYELGPEIGTDFEMPLACQSKGVVQQFRELRSYDDPLFRIVDDPLPPLKVVSKLSPLKIYFSWRMPNSDVLSMVDVFSMVYEHSTTLPPVKTQSSSTVDVNIAGMSGVLSIFHIGQSTTLSLILLCAMIVYILLCVVIVVGFIIYGQWIKHVCRVDARKLLVSNRIIARGSKGTVVFQGSYRGREVAILRLDRALYNIRETQLTIASDHPNIVQYYAVGEDKDFVYIALERCICCLDDLIQMNSNSEDLPSRAVIDEVKRMMQDTKLLKANGRPSHLLLKLMRDMVSGLVHLHRLGIIHWDLKPQNVLIFKGTSICAELSDMGYYRHGCSTSAWELCKQLHKESAEDLFSLGCVLFYCITGARHPYHYILDNKERRKFLEGIPEAEDLISLLLNPRPERRPSAAEVLQHPLLWSSEVRLSFLRDTNDRLKLERLKLKDGQRSSKLLKAIKNIVSVVLFVNWDKKLDPELMDHITFGGRFRFDSVQDLLRAVSNQFNNYVGLPQEIQELLGSFPEGLDDYFATRFPRLLIEVYKVVWIYCREEEMFQNYFKSNVV